MERHSAGTVRRGRRIARLAGALAGGLSGLAYALYLIPNSNGWLNGTVAIAAATLAVSSAAGLLCGLALGPALSIDPYLWLERKLETSPREELFGGVVGLVLALVVSALLAVPLTRLPDLLGIILPLAITGILVYIGVGVGTRRRSDLLALAGDIGGRGQSAPAAAPGMEDPLATPLGAPALVDTSVLIDARILDVAKAGFLPGRLLIPGFVLEELQRIADAGDPLRRAKGRRGLATVEGLQALHELHCEVIDVDFPGVPEVDSRLLRLARSYNASVMTTDFMLNRLAQIEGIRVLNLNSLALALKPIVSAGETMEVNIVKEGKELHQGVGYLDDGTMVVVENGRNRLDETVTATVTSVIQTPAGRMIFATVPTSEGMDEQPRPRAVRSPSRLPRVVNR
jgi:uncharacterized protein YacL